MSAAAASPHRDWPQPAVYAPSALVPVPGAPGMYHTSAGSASMEQGRPDARYAPVAAGCRRFADGGGIIPGTPPANPNADNVIAMGPNGFINVRSNEWIIKEPATQYYGNPMMSAINNMTFPKFANGGSPGNGGGSGSGDVSVEARLSYADRKLLMQVVNRPVVAEIDGERLDKVTANRQAAAVRSGANWMLAVLRFHRRRLVRRHRARGHRGQPRTGAEGQTLMATMAFGNRNVAFNILALLKGLLAPQRGLGTDSAGAGERPDHADPGAELPQALRFRVPRQRRGAGQPAGSRRGPVRRRPVAVHLSGRAQREHAAAHLVPACTGDRQPRQPVDGLLVGVRAVRCAAERHAGQPERATGCHHRAHRRAADRHVSLVAVGRRAGAAGIPADPAVRLAADPAELPATDHGVGTAEHVQRASACTTRCRPSARSTPRSPPAPSSSRPWPVRRWRRAAARAGGCSTPIAAGTSTTPTDYTTFGAMDVRMLRAPRRCSRRCSTSVVGQFLCQFSEDNIGQNITKIGVNDAGTYYELDASMDEVSSPW